MNIRTWTGSRRTVARFACALGLVGCVAMTTACSPSSAPELNDEIGAGDAPQTISFSGAPVTVTVPDGVTSVQIIATGGSGSNGASGNSNPPQCSTAGGKGAVVTGTLPVQPGQTLTVSVGGAGRTQGCDGAPAANRGWGGDGGVGGTGLDGYDGNENASGSGGGATTVESAGTTVLVAGGGGGGGATGYLLSYTGGTGADAGPGDGVGSPGHGPDSGAEGIGGLSQTAAGEGGGHGGYAGGDGGAGGGGVRGGSGAKGGQFGGGGGGGGGAGSSNAAGLTGGTISTAAAPGDGSVVLAWQS